MFLCRFSNFRKKYISSPRYWYTSIGQYWTIFAFSIVSFWITPASSKGHKYHIFRQYWYTRNVPVFTSTGTFQYLGPEVYFFQIFNIRCFWKKIMLVCNSKDFISWSFIMIFPPSIIDGWSHNYCLLNLNEKIFLVGLICKQGFICINAVCIYYTFISKFCML